MYTFERGYDTKIVIYDAASETVKDTITVSDVNTYSQNKIFVDDDGRIYLIGTSGIYILDASGNLIKQMDYDDRSITVSDVDIGPDGTLYLLNHYAGTYTISLY